jgi:S1-C subfamily serine protease
LSRSADAAAARAVCGVHAAHGTGLGFAFLEPRWVVTARHVVRDQRPGDAVELVFRRGLRSSARIAALHPHVDLAILRVAGDADDIVPLGLPTPGSAGVEPAYCLASEAGAPPDEAPHDRARLLAVPGFERTRRHRDGREEDLFIFPAPPGGSPRSGGPLLSSDGAAVAVIVDSIDLVGRTYIRATAIGGLIPSLALATAGLAR